VFCLLRSEDGSSSKSLLLDGALGAAGAATVLAAVLSPSLFGHAQQEVGVVLVSAGYAVGDLLLVAMVFGVLAVRGRRGGSLWVWLGAGLAAYCAGDVVYALQVASGTFVVGGLWEGLWWIGLTIAALSLWRPERPLPAEPRRSTAMLGIPTLATVAAVITLIVSAVDPLPVAVVVLAGFTLALAAARTLLAFHQVRRLSDAHRQAITDDLTGLGNRRGLLEYGERRGEEAPSDRIALLLIDLDDFKAVNDTLGHQAGDALLRETARRLGAGARKPEVLVRLGADEFALVKALGPDEPAREVAEGVLARVMQPVVVEGASLRVGASVGVAEARGTEFGVAELLRRADVAMSAAKTTGSGVERYRARLDEGNRSRLQTIQDLDAAIAEDQFVLHYQPKVDVCSRRIVGAEALVRWEHPTRGLLYPDTFLPLVEQSGMMGSLTSLVLHAAIAQMARWRATGTDVYVAVNLSASDLLDERLADRILALLSEHAVPVEALELELTESVLMTDPERARTVLEQLRGLGLRIAVDDYGTGYCALAYLRDLPIDELKIDRSFIAGMTGDRRSAAIVRSSIELAHALDLEVVAEGVEQLDALEMLAGFGCDFAQGFHFSRPLPAADFAALVERFDAERLAVPV
jgi:diguanylate cyclase (GGDEF)-like protein